MTEQRYAVAAAAIFDGAVMHDNGAVILEGESIAALVPRREVPAGIVLHELPDGAWLAPGFIDVQVNGGGDVLFNNEPSGTTPAQSAPSALTKQ